MPTDDFGHSIECKLPDGTTMAAYNAAGSSRELAWLIIEYKLPDGTAVVARKTADVSGQAQRCAWTVNGKPATEAEAKAILPTDLRCGGRYAETWEV